MRDERPLPSTSDGPAARAAVLHLVRLGLLDLEPVVGGRITVIDLSSRHRNVGVVGAGGHGFLVKQGATAEGIAAVAHESRVVRLLSDRLPELAPHLPRCVACHEELGILVHERLPGARSLRSESARLGRFPVPLAAELGAALATLHAGTPAALLRRRARLVARRAAGAPPRFEGSPPWVLSLHRPAVADLRTFSAANLDLVRLLQSSRELCAHLDRMRRGWRPVTLVHNDLRWENCLVAAWPGSRSPRLHIVDWEMADLGDPAWDVGSAFGGWLGPRVSATAAGRSGFDDARRPPSFRPGNAQPAIRAFWRTYRERAGLDEISSERLLVRSMRYAAARLVQNGYERHQAAPRLGPRVRAHLQLARGILRSPRQAAADLLGSPPCEPRRRAALGGPAPLSWVRA